MSDLNLQVVVGSIRPGRLGLKVAEWFVDAARAYGGFQVSVTTGRGEPAP